MTTCRATTAALSVPVLDAGNISPHLAPLFPARRPQASAPERATPIRIDAKRQALDALDNLRRGGDGANGNGKPANDVEIETIVAVSDELPSQSRHSLTLSGSPPHGKLLIPFERRDVRVVEGARLESVCTSNRTKGSNPFLSASLRRLILGGSG